MIKKYIYNKIDSEAHAVTTVVSIAVSLLPYKLKGNELKDDYGMISTIRISAIILRFTKFCLILIFPHLPLLQTQTVVVLFGDVLFQTNVLS